MKRKSKLTIAIATAVLAVLGGTAVYAQDKYSLKSPSGIAFSDFRGYEDWAVVSSARTDEVLKVIVANPTMIKAYKAGVPGNGQPFPEGSKIAKLQWSFKKSTEAPFVVDVPDAPTQAFLIEKDSKRFPKTGGWGYALFNHDVAAGKMTADPATSDCGHACHVAVKSEGLHLPPVPEALSPFAANSMMALLEVVKRAFAPIRQPIVVKSWRSPCSRSKRQIGIGPMLFQQSRIAAHACGASARRAPPDTILNARRQFKA